MPAHDTVMGLARHFQRGLLEQARFEDGRELLKGIPDVQLGSPLRLWRGLSCLLTTFGFRF
jgi:hypothetical protein